MDNTVHYRVSGPSSVMLLCVAVVIDLFPILFFVLAAVFLIHGVGDFAACAASGFWSYIKCGIAIAKAGIAGGGALMALALIGPMVYVALAVVALLFGYFLFWGWFKIAYNYDMFGMTANKLLANLLVFVLELLPVLNLLPGVTLLVLRHILLSRTEDNVKALTKTPPTQVARVGRGVLGRT